MSHFHSCRSRFVWLSKNTVRIVSHVSPSPWTVIIPWAASGVHVVGIWSGTGIHVSAFLALSPLYDLGHASMGVDSPSVSCAVLTTGLPLQLTQFPCALGESLDGMSNVAWLVGCLNFNVFFQLQGYIRDGAWDN
ncbi:hypothetical protein ElyMa_004838200 [Elysia marginata]|uniref:Uncharacterized protein n=1 Tax=Elysia marginata TaxID=1093978 RepID=A0AAV4IQU3_9GAST|nr:hypothetical protein ElyMa_004838200 [Elysia marginata]